MGDTGSPCGRDSDGGVALLSCPTRSRESSPVSNGANLLRPPFYQTPSPVLRKYGNPSPYDLLDAMVPELARHAWTSFGKIREMPYPRKFLHLFTKNGRTR